jgi:signal transduction histidine kinase
MKFKNIPKRKYLLPGIIFAFIMCTYVCTIIFHKILHKIESSHNILSVIPYLEILFILLLSIILGLILGHLVIRIINEHNKKITVLSKKILNSQEEERQKISRDLHDSISQLLMAAKVNFDAYKINPEKHHDRFEMGIRLIDRCSQELQDIYTNLFPSSLQYLGLEAAVKWYVKHYLDSRAIKTSLNFIFQKKIPSNIELNLYRIMQEILSNIVKHSMADNVKIDLRVSLDNTLYLTVEDDGKGFSIDNSEKKIQGFGLDNIRLRVEEMNGYLNVITRSGSGTNIKIKIYLDEKKKPEFKFKEDLVSVIDT